MPITQADLLFIVEESATLPERLKPSSPDPDDPFANSPFAAQGDDDSNQSAYLDEWQTIIGDGGKFAKRIAWEGLSTAQIRSRLGKLRWSNGNVIPAWAEFLKEMLAGTAQLRAEPVHYLFLRAEAPFAFEDLFAPFIEYAWSHIQKRSGAAVEKLSIAAQISLRADLLSRLSAVFWQVLNLEFTLFSVRNQGGYPEFVAATLSDGFGNLFRRYPMMARLLAQMLLFWVDSLTEFCQRLAADWPEIEARFHNGIVLEKVEALQPGMSDPHRQHQTVMIVTFAGGLRLVYKPKALGLEAAYYRLLRWLNDQGLAPDFRVLTLLERAHYGWIEYVEHQPCQSEDELRTFFQRAGMLLGIIHILHGNDAHAENLIAQGAYPILIDAETMVTPIITQITDQNTTHGHEDKAAAHTVLTTAFLPEWRVDANGKLYDLSALGHRGGQLMRRPVWEHINTEAMRLTFVPTPQPASTNSPFAMTENIPGLENYLDEVIRGFSSVYRFFADHRAELLESTHSPLVDLKQQPVRFLFRQTWLYGRLIEKSLAPENLMNGVRFSLTFEALSKAMLLFPQKPLLWPVYLDEIDALNQHDIPYFAVDSSSVDYVGATGRIAAGLFEHAGDITCLSYIRQLNEADLAAQIGYIKGAIFAQIATDRMNRSEAEAQPERPPHELPPLTTEALINYVLQIGEELRQHAVNVQGAAYWISFDMADAQRYRYQPMGYSLYGGNMGVTVCLAALELICGSYRDLVHASVQPLFRHMQDDVRSVIHAAHLGGGDGAGGLIYGLALAGTLLREASFIEHAIDLASNIRESDLEHEPHSDVLEGTAGLLLGLLALQRVVPSDRILNLAVACGDRLLAQRKPSESGLCAWPAQQDKLLCGFAHGAAGIAYSLLQLAQITGQTKFIEAAGEAIQYEQSLFLPDQQNWRDLFADSPDQGIFGLNWCHGAPGIALARLSGLEVLNTAPMQRDIMAGINSASTFYRGELDQCCCGIMGKVETLIVAAQRLQQPQYLDRAKSWAAYSTTRAERNAGYRFFGNIPTSIRNFGFFQGMSGIGYALLRLAHPDKLPSVLSWQVHP